MTRDVGTMPRERLMQFVGGAKESLADLEAEILRREEAAHHREVDRPGGHMERAGVGLATIRDVLRHVAAEPPRTPGPARGAAQALGAGRRTA